MELGVILLGELVLIEDVVVVFCDDCDIGVVYLNSY